MKKTRIFLLIFCCLLTEILAGCGQKAESTGYTIYFPCTGETFSAAAVEGETKTLAEGKEPVEGLMNLLLAGPEKENLTSVIPSGVSLQGWSLAKGVLTVDLSSRYGTLSGIDLTLADYSITMTLCQIPDVKTVRITVDGEEISYRDHQDLNQKDVLMTIHRDEPEERTVNLYFPKTDGKGLGQENRRIELTGDDTLAMTVLQAMVDGPKGKDLEGFLTAGDVLSAEIRDGTCNLNLSASFGQGLKEEGDESWLLVDALVDTLCQLDSVTAVRFLQEGAAMKNIGSIPLSQPLTSDYTVVH